MTNQEQIEEMAEEIFNSGIAIRVSDLAYGLIDNDDHFHRLAKYLYAAGYRKTFTSDLAIEYSNGVEYGIEYCKKICEKKCAEFEKEIKRLESENANLTVENEVLQSEKENLMRALEEGREEIESARKEMATEILQEFWKIKWGQSEIDNVCIRLAEKYGVEVEE